MINKLNSRAFISILIIFLIAISLISMIIGPVKISISQAFLIVMNKTGIMNNNEGFTAIQESVLWDIRMPRIILGLLVGLALGSAGAILQGLFRNPLVDPGFIGVSSGAAIGAMAAIMFSSLILSYTSDFLTPFILPVLAIIGAFITTLLIYRMSKVSGKTNIMAMLLAGIAINALAGSIIGLLVSISSDSELRSFTFWTLGGLDNGSWKISIISAIFILTSFLIIYKIRGKLDIFMLGDAEAYHLGLNVESLKKKIIFIASIMVGISVSFCGMIGFIGLVTPHIIRLFIGPKHKYLIPGSALLGSIILVLSDLICKTVIAPAQLPIGVITSIIGAPFFIWLIFSQKRRLGYSE